MPAITVRTGTVAANTTVSNILEGKRTRILPTGGLYQCSYYSNASANGLEEEVFVGGANPVERSHVSVGSTSNCLKADEDGITTFQAQGGEEVTVAVHNTTAGSLTHIGRLVVEQIA